MAIEDNDNAKERIAQPHPHAPDNINWFYKIMDRVVWKPGSPVSYEVQDHGIESIYDPGSQQYVNMEKVKDYKCVVFVFPLKNERMTTVLSFHQNSRKSNGHPGFREELCNVLNFFGGNGWLEHKFKNADGSLKSASYQPPKTDQWDRLFS